MRERDEGGLSNLPGAHEHLRREDRGLVLIVDRNLERAPEDVLVTTCVDALRLDDGVQLLNLFFQRSELVGGLHIAGIWLRTHVSCIDRRWGARSGEGWYARGVWGAMLLNRVHLSRVVELLVVPLPIARQDSKEKEPSCAAE